MSARVKKISVSGVPERAEESPSRIRDVNGLLGAGLISPDQAQDIQNLSQQYDIALSPHVVEAIGNAQNPQQDPVGMQYIPSTQELTIAHNEMEDPIGDDTYTPVKGIVHRYPDRVLLKAASVCAVYCRYCFRREMIGAGAQHLSEEEFAKALQYIRNTPQIWEVILTGGDPLVLSARKLARIVDALGEIEHVQVIRIHSRVPVANPDQIDDTVLSVLKNAKKPIYLVLHINHPKEVTEKVRGKILTLREAGCTLLSQSVLLKGVNDDAAVLEVLFKKLITLHVRPYYLHHLDRAKGTSHFRVSLARGQEIFRQLRGRVSGICLPTYVLDIPGGYGKIPVEHHYCANQGDDVFALEDYMGGAHVYDDRAEKK